MTNTIPDIAKVLLFSGAGLSHPLGLPMTNGFDDIIEPEDNELIRLLKSHLGSRFGDIEAVLSSIEELNSTDNLIYKHLLQNQSNGYFSSVKQSIDRLRDKSRLYTIELKKAVHRKLATPNISQCESLYSNILKEIRITIPNTAISFFTTNYDLTFEDSIGDNKKLQTDLQINDIDDGFILSGSLIFSTTNEQQHIELLFSIFEGNYSFFEDGYVEDNKEVLERVISFVSSWETYAINKLNWNRAMIYALCGSGDDFTKVIKQIDKNEYSGTRGDCGCSQSSDFCDIFGEANVSCLDGPGCTAAANRGLSGGCGFFWLFKCNGICRGAGTN